MEKYPDQQLTDQFSDHITALEKVIRGLEEELVAKTTENMEQGTQVKKLEFSVAQLRQHNLVYQKNLEPPKKLKTVAI